ncbi:hypothetical protein [Streptomyces sp. NPDC048192]|uniref:hypothetical protein n=1 Tax=Streptomyces sp. NPDC048192 TaxID=3365510 RepID=UPI0037211830
MIRRWFRRRALPASDADGRVGPGPVARVEEAAERGDVDAMTAWGAVLFQRHDRAGALHWWTRAWEAGNVAAAFNLGTLHDLEGDTNRAQVIWERAAALGDPDAMLGLVRQALERGDEATMDRWAPSVLAQRQAFPITALGVAFEADGREERAVHAYLRAEELGDAYAMEYRARILDRRGAHREAAALRARAATAERML